MKRYLFIFYFLFIARLAFCQQTDTILVKPGIGIDNIKLNKSSRAMVKKYRDAKYTVDEGSGIADLSDGGTLLNRSATYNSEELGVFFELSTRWVKGGRQGYYRMKLCKIIISKKAKTTNGLIIGKSTKQDVIKLYGKPSLDLYEEYKSEGIGFRFDKNGIITEIEIFPRYIE